MIRIITYRKSDEWEYLKITEDESPHALEDIPPDCGLVSDTHYPDKHLPKDFPLDYIFSRRILFPRFA